MGWSGERGQDCGQQKGEPPQEEAEVVARRREDSVGGVAVPAGEAVAAHAVLVLEVADGGLHGGASAEGALDGGGEPSLLAGDVDLEALLPGRVVAAVAGIGDHAVELGADRPL